MGFEERVVDPGPNSTQGGSNATAANDIHLDYYLYSGTTGSLTYGMPVFRDVTDAAEYNNSANSRAIPATVLSPNKPATCGNVVTATDSTATNLVCVGIFYSDDVNSVPVKGTVIRVCDRGIVPVLASAKTGGTSVKVGDILIVDATPGTAALSNGNTFVTGRTIGQAVATGTAQTSGASIIAVPGSGATTQLINASVKLT